MKEYAGAGRAKRAKKRKHYVDGMASSDEEGESLERMLDPEHLHQTKVYPSYFVKEMLGEQVTLEHFQQTGFKFPILVKERTGLHMKIPDKTFSITDVKNLVGGKRILEVMNCATQSNAEMTLKDWEEFFTAPDRDNTKLNVISLEFSHTRLDKEVIAPRVVRQIDFTDTVWPRHLKEQQEDGSNDMSRMLYPKVQKYCLMSIEGCYTDFHVDLGGTSVWYHVLKGKKVFWLIPPTSQNLKAFEHWTMSGKQNDVFFGDLVEKCGRAELEPGNTFFIPSGWIHAVFTPVDSLVFGGNYLFPFAIERQLKIAQLEETLKVPHKYRFPFFTEMMWFVLDRYCYHLLGRHHLACDQETLTKLLGTEEERKAFQENIGHPHITPEEVRGLKSIVLYLHSLPGNKKSVPALLRDPVSLVRDIRVIVEVHKTDSHQQGVTGRPLLYWPGLGSQAGWWCRPCRPAARPASGPAPRSPAGTLDPGLVCAQCGLDGWWAEPRLEVDRGGRGSALLECRLCHALNHPDCHPELGVDGKREEEEPGWWTCPSCILSPPPDPAPASKEEPMEMTESHPTAAASEVVSPIEPKKEVEEKQTVENS